MSGYYYRQLDREKRGVYDAMLAGMEALAPAIRVPRLDGPELSDIYLRLKLDTPLLFYVTGFQYRWMPGADHVELLPEYLFDKGKIRQHRQAVAARLDRLARPLQGKSDRDKELAIHAFILENVRYDKLKKPYSHEIIGPLTQGVGVCEGIAKTVKALCDAVQLPCIVALSEAAPERRVHYRHPWNVITVDGQRYHLDATFDNSLQRGTPRYDYFNLDDRHIFRDHEALVLPLPPCTADKGYYYRALSFTKPEDVESRARQALRKKQAHFVFHWRGGGLNRELLTDLLTRYGKQHGVEFKVTWHSSAMEMLSDKGHYDLCLLDIEMPGINGMEAAGLLRTYDETIPIIFVTNLAKYAVKGYEVGALGFIVKPVSYGGLSLSLDRALRAIGANAGRSVAVPTEDGVRVVPLRSIIYVEVTKHRLTYHIENEEPLEARGSLVQLEEELAEAPVVRVSKSCLANMDKISLVRNAEVQMTNGDLLRISRTHKKEVVDKVTDYLGGRR